MKFKDIFDLQGENLAEYLDTETLKDIGSTIHQGYRDDRESRRGWEERNAEALKIALQVKETKTFPWQNAANVKYPLVTMACVQYNARSYGALVTGDTLIRPVDGGEQRWNVARKADKYIRNEIEDWEEGQDKLLIVQALTGCPIKKTYRTEDGVKSELILPDRFVIDYNAKSLNKALRKTHLLWYFRNELEEDKRSGFFRDIDLSPVQRMQTMTADVEDEAHGQNKPPSQDGHEILETHGWYDLDEDGYAEPYIFYIDEESREVLRIHSRWEKIFMSRNGSRVEGYAEELEKGGYRIARIVPEEFFTKYPFIPAPDGSFYDIGFGTLLLPINEASDSLLNQLIDSGTLANVQGGLLARNVRVRSGKVEIVPGKFIRTEANAQDLAKGVYPWPIKEPSQVLFALLQFLLEAGERVGSVTDVMTGENPGQNQAATTTIAVLEQGMQVHNAIYKRTWRAQTEEFRKIYKHLNDMDPKSYDVPAKELELTADPNVMSTSQRLLKAEALSARVERAPHLYGFEGQVEAEKRYLQALQIAGSDRLLANPQPPQNPQAELEKAELEIKAQKNQIDESRLQLDAVETMAGIEESRARIEKMQADIENENARTILEDSKVVLDHVSKRAEAILKRRELEQRSQDRGVSQGA